MKKVLPSPFRSPVAQFETDCLQYLRAGFEKKKVPFSSVSVCNIFEGFEKKAFLRREREGRSQNAQGKKKQNKELREPTQKKFNGESLRVERKNEKLLTDFYETAKLFLFLFPSGSAFFSLPPFSSSSSSLFSASQSPSQRPLFSFSLHSI